MRIFTFLISCFIFSFLNVLYGQSNLEVIDSIIIRSRGHSKAIVLDDHHGNRHEYIFDNHGKLTEDVRMTIIDKRKNDVQLFIPYLSIDSLYHNNDSTIDIEYLYSLKDNKKSFEKSLKKMNTSVEINGKQITYGGDTTIVTDTISSNRFQDKYVIKNGKYTCFQSEFTGGKTGKEYISYWEIYYEKNKVFFIDPDFMFLYVLSLKNGIPVKLESCWLPLKHAVKSVDFVLANSKKLRIHETTEIRYGNNASCMENTILSSETMERYKKFNYIR